MTGLLPTGDGARGMKHRAPSSQTSRREEKEELVGHPFGGRGSFITACFFSIYFTALHE